MDQFALIFRHEDGTKVASPEQIEIWMRYTMEWIGGIATQGKFVSGMGLPFADAKVVAHNGMVTNGPFGDIKETLGGFIIVKADSVEEAVEFAKGSPVLQDQCPFPCLASLFFGLINAMSVLFQAFFSVPAIHASNSQSNVLSLPHWEYFPGLQRAL